MDAVTTDELRPLIRSFEEGGSLEGDKAADLLRRLAATQEALERRNDDLNREATRARAEAMRYREQSRDTHALLQEAKAELARGVHEYMQAQQAPEGGVATRPAMSEKELRLAATLLDQFSDLRSNAICNDWDWPEEFTPEEKLRLVEVYHRWNGDPEEFDPAYLHLQDYSIMSLMAARLRGEV